MTEGRLPQFRLLFLITTPKLAGRAEHMFGEGKIPVLYRFYGQGTASSEMMDMLGLSGVDKGILMTILPKRFADELLKKMKKQLRLGFVNTGVAFTVPLSGGSGGMLRLAQTLLPPETAEEVLKKAEERRETEMAESEYAMIMAIVDQGYTEDVMNAARPLGATGGTALHGRRVGSEAALRFWGISVQPERELVVIIASKQEKHAIMQAIGEKCGMRTEAHGIVLSLPVDGVAGIE